MSDDIVVNIDFRGNAPGFLAELSRAVGRAKQQLQEMGQQSAALSRLENQLARMSTVANQNAQATARAAQSVQGWSQRWTPFKGGFAEAEANSKALWRSIDTGISSAEGSLGRATRSIQQFDEAQRVAAQSRVGGNPMADWDEEFRRLSAAADDNANKVKRAQQAIEEYQNSLSNSRYVLYDVAGTLGIMGAGLIAPLAAVIAVAVNFEREFAQVARTSGAVGSELQSLKQSFDDLYGAIPITYDALAQIATLAGQLGVPADQIASFTETVAKTAAVTDLSVDQAATAFGRLNALIPNVRGQYDRLGSAIAKVGVNSVATESEIVNISTQISSMGSFAGFTAQDIIGLSGALASIGAQPELSRGTVTRVFTLMSRAVAQGGADLEQFARVSGVSAEQFASTWGTPAFTNTFLGFMAGIRNEGGNAVATLNELGVTSVRDVPLLLRLANAADTAGKAGGLLAQTIGDSNQGWTENIELQRQFEIIAGTVAARFEVLVNNINLFLQAIGGPALGGLAEFISFLTDLVKGATDFAQSDIGGAIFRVAAALSAVLGFLALAGAGMALFGASSIGVYQALTFLSTASPRATAALLGTAGAARLADGSLKAGAASATLFGRALRALTIVGVITLLPDILGSINSEFQKMRGVDLTSAAGSLREIATSGDFLASYFRTNGSIAQNFASDIANSFTGIGVTVKAANEALRQMATEGNFEGIAKELNDFDRAAKDVDAERVLELFPDITSAAKAAGIELKVVGDEIVVVGAKGEEGAAGTEEFAGGMAALEAEIETANGSLQEYKDLLDAINGTQISAAAAQDALQSSINSANEALRAEGVALDGANDSSIAFRDSLREIEQKARDAGVAIAENGGSTEEAMGAWNLGRESVIGMLEAMGMSRDEAVLWAETNLGKAGDVARAMDGVKQSVDRIPDGKNINITTSGVWPAISEIQRINRELANIPAYKHITVGVGGGVSGLQTQNRASGGPVWGPGTATSDSILARLSNGEFVVRAAAAKAIGHGRLDYMNQTGRLPAFANGGSVGMSAPSISYPGSMLVELSPTDRALLAAAGNVQLSIDGRVIAGATNGANLVSARRGTN